MDFHKDYYKILGIEQTASETEIKLAYRRLAVRYHPDRNPGKPEYEELTKELNEAKEVLLNAEKRFAYDEYRRMEQNILNEQAKKSAEPQPQSKDTTAKEPRTRTRTVVNELRIYITGTISIKYYAPQDMERFDPSLRESYYQINPTANTATINTKDCVWSETHPVNFAQIFDQYPIFPGRILQPVTTLVKDGEMSQHYELFIRELRIPDPTVVLVTKHENSSYGTIEGVFYGYVRDFEEHQVTEIIEEKEKEPEYPPFRYAGPTGRKEEKYQRGWYKMREEYYYPNGSTFWGSWHNTRPGGGYNFVPTTPVPGGCAGSGLGILVWAFVLLWMIIRAPYILPVIGLYFLLFLIGQLFTGRKGGSIIGGLVFLFYLLGLIGLLMQDHRFTRRRSTTSPVQTENVRDSREPPLPRRQPVADTSSAYHAPDTLVTRFRQWTDYSGRIFAGNYTYRTSWLRAAMRFKKDIPYTDDSPRGYDRVIHAIKENDAPHMTGVYHLFDSLRTAGNLSQTEFAEMVVSFVQDIPYSVVLDDACDPSLYHDAFISKYLSIPDAICVPHQRFGIYSPLEFVANVNGDCDTRTLFSYLVLSHYGYGVVLLSSEVYRHSMIGISLPYVGKVYEYGHNRYVVWEATAKHARPGVLPPEISNMAAWRISLLNQP